MVRTTEKKKMSVTKKICRLSPTYRLVDNELARRKQKKEQKERMKQVRKCKR